MKKWTLEDFVRESNLIERITRQPTEEEMKVSVDFLSLPSLTVEAVETLVGVLEPGAVLRTRPGMNVRVGSYFPPHGGPHIKRMLEDLLHWANLEDHRREDAYSFHLQYETIHPFTDGNGRSGRLIWLWMRGGVEKAQLGFLHKFYYDTLANR